MAHANKKNNKIISTCATTDTLSKMEFLSKQMKIKTRSKLIKVLVDERFQQFEEVSKHKIKQA